MINWYINLNYPWQALIATMFTWAITSLGSAVVFFFKKVNKNTMDAMLALSAGVMLAATFWSLLSPAIEMANSLKLISWLVVSFGVLLGGLLLFVGDKIFDKLTTKKENSSSLKRSLMLIFSITLHNIPEGLAVAGPVYAATGSKRTAVFWAGISGMAEILGGVLAWLILGSLVSPVVMAAIMAAVAGIMVALSVDELMPLAKEIDPNNNPSYGVLCGMSVMGLSLVLLQTAGIG